MIELDNKKIKDFLLQRDELVKTGRQISVDIEKIEDKIRVFESKEKMITSKIKPSKEHVELGQKLTDEINEKIKELEKLGNDIDNAKLAAIHADMKKEHLSLMDEKEKLERERNKVALKVQKIKDRMVPLIQKEVKPLLKDEFDDIETAIIEDGKVIIKTCNYLADWKRTFRNTRK